IINLVEDPQCDVNRLVPIIGQDAAISTKLLNVSNSVAYRGMGEIQDVRSAILKLGMREVAQIAAGVAGSSLFDVTVRAEFELFTKRWRALFFNAMTVAFAAGWLSIDRNLGRPDRVFLGGMLHDVGKSIVLRSLSALVIGGTLNEPPSDAAVERVLEELHV